MHTEPGSPGTPAIPATEDVNGSGSENESESENPVRQALSLLFSEGSVVELRALGDGGVHSGYFTDFDMMAEKAAAMDTFRDIHGIYVTLNEVNPALLSRRVNRVKQRLSRTDVTTADADIIHRRWLPIDLDPVRPSGVSATDAEHEAALDRAEQIDEWLEKRGFPEPVLADSGNGAHLLYAIDLPNDGESTRLVKGCLTVLDALFSDDTVHCDTANFNAGRIWKLYGTTARKGDNTNDRPHRKARILSTPDEPEVVPEDMLRDLADCIPRSAPVVDTGRRRDSFDLRRWLEKNNIAVRTERPWQGGTLFTLAECPFSTAHTDGAFAIQFENGALFAGCHHDSCGGGTQRWQELRAMYGETTEPVEGTGNRSGKNRNGNNRIKKNRTKKNPEKSLHTAGRAVTPAPSDKDDEKPTPDEDHRRQASALLEKGDPLAFLLDTFSRDHVGDRTVAECLIMSIASQSVVNTHGIHVSVSGNSGKGKSHACSTMLRQVPDAYRLAGTVSDKALYYNTGIRAGSVFLFDDVGLSDDLQEILKSATAAFRERIEHQTLTSDRQLKVCSIPERCVWWLAKVESIGDDQVMNRMLSVWIDDSKDQDQRVLDNLRHCEAVEGEVPGCCDDVLVCQAVWELLKGEYFTVQIPFAERVRFSSVQNRRNPNMLFDLIKAHALLFRFQREGFTTTEGGEGIRATEEDFTAAARLYRDLHTGAGGQETKLTKNEAAALKTIDTLDMPEFTARKLQHSLGVSYCQVCRVLHGYTSRGRTYSGLLEKCPALSYVDVTVTEDNITGPVRKRENLYTFDRDTYRQWNGSVVVWLNPAPPGGDGTGDDHNDRPPTDGGDDVGGMAAAWRQDGGTCRHNKTGAIRTNDTDLRENKETLLQEKRILRKNETPQHPDISCADACPGGCAPADSANQNASGAIQTEMAEQSNIVALYDGGSLRHPLHSAANAANEGASCVCETECPSGIIPLPGMFTAKEFSRTAKDLGNCSVCGGGRIAWWSEEGRMGVCETCYSRLLREKNWEDGVV